MCRGRGWEEPAGWGPGVDAPVLVDGGGAVDAGAVDPGAVAGAGVGRVRGVSDQEREAASSELRLHFTEGRLDVDEFSSRLDEAWQAQTTADLDAALRQLPPISGRPRPWARPEMAPAQTGWAAPTRPAPAAHDRRRPMWVNVVVAIVAVWLAVALWPIWLIALVAWLLVKRHHRRQDRYDAWYGWYA